MKKKRIAVVCPGRGTYTKAELGYLASHRSHADAFIKGVDARLASLGQPTVSELDGAERFSLRTHTPGEFASTLIYTCSACDFMAIDRDRYEIVAVTGNSMGWYTSLFLAGALNADHGFSLIHTMGSMMKGGVVGGQLIYPLVDDNWQHDPAKADTLERLVSAVNDEEGCEVHDSIDFGGYRILGGTEKALKRLMQELPPVDDRYPFILVNHAAFHTPLLNDVSAQAFRVLGDGMFEAPDLPLVDGRGKIWQPASTDPKALRQYTLGHQVVEPYDFSQAIRVTLKEFAPDQLVLLGPGATSGGAIGQILVQESWRGVTDKEAFKQVQGGENPLLLAMGRPDQAGVLRSKGKS